MTSAKGTGTGVRDRNSVEILEGDILRVKYEYLFRVHRDPCSGEWAVSDMTGFHRISLARVALYGEVVLADRGAGSGFKGFVKDDSGGY